MSRTVVLCGWGHRGSGHSHVVELLTTSQQLSPLSDHPQRVWRATCLAVERKMRPEAGIQLVVDKCWRGGLVPTKPSRPPLSSSWLHLQPQLRWMAFQHSPPAHCCFSFYSCCLITSRGLASCFCFWCKSSQEGHWGGNWGYLLKPCLPVWKPSWGLAVANDASVTSASSAVRVCIVERWIRNSFPPTREMPW